MKYILVLCDGMADEKQKQLDNKTPLEYAKTPTMDELSKISEIGMVKTVPDNMAPGSDTANLSVLGYDPQKYYSGRSPLEALSIGVNMKETDIAIRMNFVTLSENDGDYESQTIIDHSSSEISTEEAAILLDSVRKAFENEEFKFYLGTSYRHLLIWDKGEVINLVQPHDILTQVVEGKLPTNEKLADMMKKSYEILKNHPINIKRKEQGLNPANSIWFWGAGTKPMLDNFEQKTNKRGVMISAVDLLKGIAVGSEMKVIEVEGATGGLETNYDGKAKAAVDALLKENMDFAYIHIEAPDEMGHQGSVERKIQAIENIDKKVIAFVKEKMDESKEDYRILVLPDHPTPVRIRTHTSDPVPYLLYDSRTSKESIGNYSEETGGKSKIMFNKGYELIKHFFCN